MCGQLSHSDRSWGAARYEPPKPVAANRRCLGLPRSQHACASCASEVFPSIFFSVDAFSIDSVSSFFSRRFSSSSALSRRKPPSHRTAIATCRTSHHWRRTCGTPCRRQPGDVLPQNLDDLLFGELLLRICPSPIGSRHLRGASHGPLTKLPAAQHYPPSL